MMLMKSPMRVAQYGDVEISWINRLGTATHLGVDAFFIVVDIIENAIRYRMVLPNDDVHPMKSDEAIDLGDVIDRQHAELCAMIEYRQVRGGGHVMVNRVTMQFLAQSWAEQEELLDTFHKLEQIPGRSLEVKAFWEMAAFHIERLKNYHQHLPDRLRDLSEIYVDFSLGAHISEGCQTHDFWRSLLDQLGEQLSTHGHDLAALAVAVDRWKGGDFLDRASLVDAVEKALSIQML